MEPAVTPTTQQDLEDLLTSRLNTMPEGYRKIARCVFSRYQEVAFMRATELAREADVSQATVTRFADFLGFGSYAQFIKTLQNLVRIELKAPDRMRYSSRTDEGGESRYARVLHQEAELILSLRQTLDSHEFWSAAQLIADAEEVAVVGFRTGAVVVPYLTYFLHKVRPRVLSFTEGGSAVYDQLIDADPAATVIVAIVFPRYPVETLKLLDYLHGRGFTIICITDSPLSPAVPRSEVSLVTPIDMATLFDSYAAPISLVNVLIDAVSQIYPHQTKERLGRLEELFEQVNLFHSKG